MKVSNTVIPKYKKKHSYKNFTIGELEQYWNKNGHFNKSLYMTISKIKALK
jgi:hypothetical protein